MPIGLTNAAQAFLRFIHGVLRGLDFAYAYLDDILIATENAEQHERDVDEMLRSLDQAGLTLNGSKCA